MTERSYQECRKLMQQINYIRGCITEAKGDVAKWTNIEQAYKDNLQEAKAEGANKMLQKALTKLDALNKKFSEIKFPDSDLPQQSIERCPECHAKLSDCVCNYVDDSNSKKSWPNLK